jgi:hypothetical protein
MHRLVHYVLFSFVVLDGFGRWSTVRTRQKTLLDVLRKRHLPQNIRAMSTTEKKELRTLYPPIEPFNTGKLKVSDIHEIYYEESGNPDGKPVVFLHGGPGGKIPIIWLK